MHEIVDWGDGGNYFEIKNLERFTNEILSKHYKTGNYYSFVRQLNFYGFSKIHSDIPTTHCFQNIYFLKDFPEMLSKITRKKVKVNTIKKIQLGKTFLDMSFLGNEASDIERILKDFNSTIGRSSQNA